MLFLEPGGRNEVAQGVSPGYSAVPPATQGSRPGLPDAALRAQRQERQGRRGVLQFVAVSAICFSLPAAAIDVDELLAKSIEARGGQASWDAVETLCVRGSYSVFSTPRPFSLCRKRPDLYRFEHQLLDSDVVFGYDGERAWWINESPISPVPWASEPPPHYQAAIAAEADVGGPLLDAAERGHRVKLFDRVDLDGVSLWEVEVALRSGTVESWFLDPQSFLPRTRLSTGASGPQPADRRVDFYDWREVAGGILVPHRLEIEIGYNFEVMEIDAVTVNGDLEDRLFEMPVPEGMQPLQGLAGTWQVHVEGWPNPGIPFAETADAVHEIRSSGHGSFLVEELAYPLFGTPRRITRWRSWDRFRDVYRVVLFDAMTGLADVLEGRFADGRLTVSDVETGTSWSARGQTFHTREETYDLTPDGFKVDLSTSTDGGDTWVTSVRFAYTRVPEE